MQNTAAGINITMIDDSKYLGYSSPFHQLI